MGPPAKSMYIAVRTEESQVRKFHTAPAAGTENGANAWNTCTRQKTLK